MHAFHLGLEYVCTCVCVRTCVLVLIWFFCSEHLHNGNSCELYACFDKKNCISMNDCIWWTKMWWYIMQSSFIFKWVASNLLGEGKSLHAYDNESVCVFSQRLIVYLLVSNTKSKVFPFIYLFVCFSNNKPARHLI